MNDINLARHIFNNYEIITMIVSLGPQIRSALLKKIKLAKINKGFNRLSKHGMGQLAAMVFVASNGETLAVQVVNSIEYSI